MVVTRKETVRLSASAPGVSFEWDSQSRMVDVIKDARHLCSLSMNSLSVLRTLLDAIDKEMSK